MTKSLFEDAYREAWMKLRREEMRSDDLPIHRSGGSMSALKAHMDILTHRNIDELMPGLSPDEWRTTRQVAEAVGMNIETVRNRLYKARLFGRVESVMDHSGGPGKPPQARWMWRLPQQTEDAA